MSETHGQLDHRDGYKEVVLGPSPVAIPEHWRVRTLGEIADIVSGNTPKKSEPDYWGGDIVWITPTDVTTLNRKYITESEEYITEAGLANSSATLIEPGAVLMTSRATIGEVVINEVPVTTNQGFKTLIPNGEVDSEYLYYYIPSIKSYLNAIGGGSTFSEVSKSDVSNIKIPVPSLPEQRHIADILSTVDKQIQRTDEIIQKTEELRHGLMTEFFHTGYYDHSLIQKPPFGQIPDDWDIHELSEVADVEMGSSPKSKYYNEDGNGLPFYQANNEFGYRTPTHDRWCSEPKKIANKGDTLVTIRGTYVGQVNVAVEQCCIGRGLAAVGARKVDQEYLYHHLAHRERYVKSIASGSTFDSINTNELETLSVLVPDRDEQKKIAACLRKVQEQFLVEREYKQHLQELKRGLMQDLLTGKVRVDTDN